MTDKMSYFPGREIILKEWVRDEEDGRPVLEDRFFYEIRNSASGENFAIFPYQLPSIATYGHRPVFAPELARIHLDNPGHPICTEEIRTGSLVIYGLSKGTRPVAVFVHTEHPFLSEDFMSERIKRMNEFHRVLARILNRTSDSTDKLMEAGKAISKINSVPQELFEGYIRRDGERDARGDQVIWVCDYPQLTGYGFHPFDLLAIDDFIKERLSAATLGLPAQERDLWGEWYKEKRASVINRWKVTTHIPRDKEPQAHFISWRLETRTMQGFYGIRDENSVRRYVQPEGRCAWHLGDTYSFSTPTPSLFKKRD